MKKGFTLLELLIVIIIIGLLAAIGVTQYAKAVRNAKIAQAKGTLSEMKKAAMAYNSIAEGWPVMAAGDWGIGADMDNDAATGSTRGNEVEFVNPTSAPDWSYSSTLAGKGIATGKGTMDGTVITLDFITGAFTVTG